jgi:hypothetical protein
MITILIKYLLIIDIFYNLKYNYWKNVIKIYGEIKDK